MVITSELWPLENEHGSYLRWGNYSLLVEPGNVSLLQSCSVGGSAGLLYHKEWESAAGAGEQVRGVGGWGRAAPMCPVGSLCCCLAPSVPAAARVVASHWWALAPTSPFSPSSGLWMKGFGWGCWFFFWVLCSAQYLPELLSHYKCFMYPSASNAKHCNSCFPLLMKCHALVSWLCSPAQPSQVSCSFPSSPFICRPD